MIPLPKGNSGRQRRRIWRENRLSISFRGKRGKGGGKADIHDGSVSKEDGDFLALCWKDFLKHGCDVGCG
jgi:hypothetical protein